MALDTRLIGQATGGGRPLDLAKAVRPAVIRGEQALERRKRIDFERKKLEAKNLSEQNKRTEKILVSLFNKENKIKVNNELTQGYWKNKNNAESFKAKKNKSILYNSVKTGELDQYEALVAQEENVNKLLTVASERADNYRNFYNTAGEIKKNISSSVASDVVDKVNGIIEGDENIINSVSKELNVDPDDLLNAETLNKLGYIAADTTGIGTLFDTVQSSANSAASKGADFNGYIQKVKQDLSQLNLSDMQYISAAFDFLGKETPGFTSPFTSYIDEDMKAALKAKDINAIPDTDGDGNPMNEIKAFVNDAMIKAAEDSYDAFKKDYADKFDSDIDPNKQPKSDAEEYVDELNNALSNYDFSMLNNSKIAGKLITGSEIRNGKLYLEYIARTTAEGQEIAELAPIDLNDKNKLKALLQEYVKGQKGISMSNKISNFINNSELFTIAEVNKQNSILFPSPTTKPQLP